MNVFVSLLFVFNLMYLLFEFPVSFHTHHTHTHIIINASAAAADDDATAVHSIQTIW